MSILNIALLINAVLLTVLLLFVYRLWLSLQLLKESTHDLLDGEQDFPELKDREPRHVIVLEILNPIALVADRSWIGGKFSAMSPGTIRRIVHTQTRNQLRAGMKENGVEADVRVVRLG